MACGISAPWGRLPASRWESTTERKSVAERSRVPVDGPGRDGRFGTLGGRTSCANDVNDLGCIVGVKPNRPDRCRGLPLTRAFLRMAGREPRRPGYPGGQTTARRRQSPKRLAACCGSRDTAMTPPAGFARSSGRCVWVVRGGFAVLAPRAGERYHSCGFPAHTHTLEGGAMTAPVSPPRNFAGSSSPQPLETSSSGTTFISSGAWPRSVGPVLLEDGSGRGVPLDRRDLFGRLPDFGRWEPSSSAGSAISLGASTPSSSTLSGMGISQPSSASLPSYASIGVAAAFILFFLRLIQGLCLGGEYAARSRTSRARPRRKTRLLHRLAQTSPTLGIVVSLAVIIGTRESLARKHGMHGGGGFRSSFRS